MMNSLRNGRPHLRLGMAVRMLLTCAGIACAALTAVAADAPKKFYAPTALPAWRVTYNVAFEKGQRPTNRLFLHCASKAGESEQQWKSLSVDVCYAGFPRVYGWFRPGFAAIPRIEKCYETLPEVAPGQKLRAEVTYADGVLDIRGEVNGEMRLLYRDLISTNMLLYGVSFKEGTGKVSNVKIAANATKGRDNTTLVLPLPAPGAVTRATFRPGIYPALGRFVCDDGSKQPPAVQFRSFRQTVRVRKEEKEQYLDGGVPMFRKVKTSKYQDILDSGISFSIGDRHGRQVYSITRMGGRYTDAQLPEMLDHLDQWGEPASRHDFLVELRRGAKGCELWLENSYLTTLEMPQGCTAVTLQIPAEGVAKRLPDGREAASERTLALNVPEPFDTSLCHMDLGSFSLECDGYLSREPHDALPGAFLRRVPAATYAEAVVRCRVDASERNTCELTARLTNFRCPTTAGRSPEAMTQVTLDLPRTNGELTVRLPFDPGRIQDLIHDSNDDFLDFELLGGLEIGGATRSAIAYKPRSRPSGVTVLSVELVRAPASLHVANGAYRNTFVDGETPSVTAEVRAEKAGDYRLSWRSRDLDGRILEEQSEKLTLGAGETAAKTIAFAGRAVGWYDYAVVLENGKGEAVVRFPGAYVVLAKDDRKAGYESPYFTWNGIGSMSTNDFRREAAYLKKLGIRRTQLKKYTEEDAKEFGLTLGEGYNFGARGATLEEKKADFKKTAKEMLAKWPHLSSALIFHESGHGPLPQELVGGKTELTPADIKKQEENLKEGVWRAECWREVAPQVRLKVGNCGSSLGIMADLFRAGYPKHLIDVIGEESVGQTMTPERSTAGCFRNLKDLAELYGYTNGVEACYEWKSRIRRAFNGNLRKHAAWQVRDALIALAWGSRNVTVHSTPEIGNSYYNTCWGDGALSRRPLAQPYPILAATAHLTRVLDRCAFVRLVPTGSQTVYLLEFRKPEGAYVYAGWTARGVVTASLASSAPSATFSDLYGRERKLADARKMSVELSEEPVYLTLAAPLTAADATGPRAYPWETYPQMKGMKTLVELTDAAQLAFITNKNPAISHGRSSLKYMAKGDFEVKAATDGGRACLAIVPRAQPELPDGPRNQRFGFFQLDKPVDIPDAATTVTMDVKGNSSWSKMLFQVEDAKGRLWISAGPGFDYYDYPDTMSLNYEGWHTLQFMVRRESPARCPSIGANMKQWQGWSDDRREFAYPLKLVGIGVAVRRKGFGILDWQTPPTDEIRIRSLGCY